MTRILGSRTFVLRWWLGFTCLATFLYSQEAKPEQNVEERLLETVTGTGVFGRVHFSPDGSRVARISNVKPKGYSVVLNGTPGDPFDFAVNVDFSRNGGRSACYALQDGKSFIILDGKKGELLDEIGLVKSKTFPFRFGFGKVDSVPVWRSESMIGPYGPAGLIEFSPDGKRVAYVGVKGGKTFVSVDEKVIGDFDAVGGLAFSSDGQHTGFWAKVGGTAFAVRDGLRSEAFDDVGPISFSKEGSHWAFPAEKDGKAFAVIDGVKSETPGRLESLVLSPDGKRSASVMLTTDRKRVAVIDGIPGPEFSFVERLTFSPDSRHIAYAGENLEGIIDRKAYPIVDGKRGDIFFERITQFVYSSNSSRLLYVAKGRPGWKLVVDGVSVSAEYISSAGFCSKEMRLRYVFREKGKYFAAGEGIATTELDNAVIDSGVFDSTGTRMGYGSIKGREIWWRVALLK